MACPSFGASQISGAAPCPTIRPCIRRERRRCQWAVAGIRCRRVDSGRGRGDLMTRMGVAFSGGLPPADIVECVKLAETLGYESAWVAEGHGGDQFAILGACAVATRRILLGTSISSVFVRSAPTIGMAAATVDQLADGRFILGLGGSHRVQVEPEHGI